MAREGRDQATRALSVAALDSPDFLWVLVLWSTLKRYCSALMTCSEAVVLL